MTTEIVLQIVSASVGVLGGAAGIGGLAMSRRSVRLQQQALQVALEGQQRSQAQRVLVFTKPVADRTMAVGRDCSCGVLALVHNSSDAPIFGVSLLWSHDEHGELTHRAARASLPPGSSWEVRFPRSCTATPGSLSAKVWFFDTAGRGWQRDAGGGLSRLRELATSPPSGGWA